jgi:acyl carrier protein
MSADLTTEEILEVVRAETGVDIGPEQVRSSMSDLGLASFPLTRTVLALEELFEVELTPDELVLATQTPIDELGDLYRRARPTG